MFLPKEALISLSANSSTSLKRLSDFRLVGGRWNIYVWILALGLIIGTVAGAFRLIALVGSRHGWCSRGRAWPGHCGPPHSECTRLDSTRLLLCLG